MSALPNPTKKIPPPPSQKWNPSWLHRDFNLPRPDGEMLAVYSAKESRWLEIYGLARGVGARAFMVNTFPKQQPMSWVYFPADGDTFVVMDRWSGAYRVLEVQK